jgi:Na+/phosphate symporter
MDAQVRNREALTGVGFGVLALAGNLLQGSVPTPHGKPAEAVEFYSGHPGRIAIGMAIALLGVVLLYWFVAVLRDALAQRGALGERLGSVVLVGGAAGGALLAAGLALNTVAALRAREQATISGDLAAGFFDGSFVLMGLASAGGLAVVMIATGVGALKLGVLPRWLGWLSVAMALPGLLSPVAFTMLLLCPLWAIIVGVVLYHRSPIRNEKTPA